MSRPVERMAPAPARWFGIRHSSPSSARLAGPSLRADLYFADMCSRVHASSAVVVLGIPRGRQILAPHERLVIRSILRGEHEPQEADGEVRVGVLGPRREFQFDRRQRVAEFLFAVVSIWIAAEELAEYAGDALQVLGKSGESRRMGRAMLQRDRTRGSGSDHPSGSRSAMRSSSFDSPLSIRWARRIPVKTLDMEPISKTVSASGAANLPPDGCRTPAVFPRPWQWRRQRGRYVPSVRTPARHVASRSRRVDRLPPVAGIPLPATRRRGCPRNTPLRFLSREIRRRLIWLVRERWHSEPPISRPSWQSAEQWQLAYLGEKWRESPPRRRPPKTGQRTTRSMNPAGTRNGGCRNTRGWRLPGRTRRGR